jgi:hypothetical protein
MVKGKLAAEPQEVSSIKVEDALKERQRVGKVLGLLGPASCVPSFLAVYD